MVSLKKFPSLSCKPFGVEEEVVVFPYPFISSPTPNGLQPMATVIA